MNREYTLRLCAELLNEGKLDDLREVLKPYEEFSLEKTASNTQTPLHKAFSARHLERIRKRLSRLPRQITKAYTRRAAVVIPLCMYEGVPSVLLTLRSLSVGKHKGEVCFPGGMVDDDDISIEGTCLREMNEEVGLLPEAVQVLGILRCDWSSVTSITGIAVTPVVGFVGEMSNQSFAINEAEVESLFTVSLHDLLEPKNWIRRPNATPVFTGGPHIVWGLTAYLLDICLTEVLMVHASQDD
jgi:nudix motif 8